MEYLSDLYGPHDQDQNILTLLFVIPNELHTCGCAKYVLLDSSEVCTYAVVAQLSMFGLYYIECNV